MLHIVGGDVRGCMNSPCVQLRITYTCITCFEGLCVRFSPAGYSVAILGTLEDARIPHEFNAILLFIAGIRTI